MKRNTKKAMWLTLLLGSLLFITACSFKQDVTYNENEYTVDAIKVNEISLADEGKRIFVKKSKDKKIHVTYNENSNLSYQIKVSEEGTMTIKSTEKKDWKDYVGLKDRGTLFLELLIPDNATTNLKIDSKKGRVNFYDFNIDGKLQVNSDIESIEGERVAATKGITLKTEKAPISILSPITKDDMTVETTKGNIDLTGVKYGKLLNLKTKKGNVTALVNGKEESFEIHSNVKNGKSNVPKSKKGAKKKINIDVDKGNVNLDFILEQQDEKNEQ